MTASGQSVRNDGWCFHFAEVQNMENICEVKAHKILVTDINL